MEFVDKPSWGGQQIGDAVKILDPRTAYMTGAIKTTDIQDLEMFERAFPANPSVIVQVIGDEKAKGAADGSKVESADDVSPEDKSDLMFLKMLPLCFNPGMAGDWDTVMHWKIEGAADYTISVANGSCEIAKGLHGEHDTLIETTYEGFRLIVRHRVLDDSGFFSEEQLDDWSEEAELDVELSDDQLEAISGGKGGGCGAEASGASACGGDACGAAACGGAACGAAACGAAACGADACGVAAGAGGVCAANACGVDVSPGWDIGGCAINVVPGVPGT